MENIALFASAVAVGNFAGLGVDALNNASLTYIVARIVYNVSPSLLISDLMRTPLSLRVLQLLYIMNTSEPASALRTGAFGTGALIVFSAPQ